MSRFAFVLATVFKDDTSYWYIGVILLVVAIIYAVVIKNKCIKKVDVNELFGDDESKECKKIENSKTSDLK